MQNASTLEQKLTLATGRTIPAAQAIRFMDDEIRQALEEDTAGQLSAQEFLSAYEAWHEAKHGVCFSVC